jgi:hypothetical protein
MYYPKSYRYKPLMRDPRPVINSAKGYIYNCGDFVASSLMLLSVAEVVSLALNIYGGTNIYSHLNNGQQRMCWGMRFRGSLKRNDITPLEFLEKVQEVAERSVLLQQYVANHKRESSSPRPLQMCGLRKNGQAEGRSQN